MQVKRFSLDFQLKRLSLNIQFSTQKVLHGIQRNDTAVRSSLAKPHVIYDF